MTHETTQSKGECVSGGRHECSDLPRPVPSNALSHENENECGCVCLRTDGNQSSSELKEEWDSKKKEAEKAWGYVYVCM